MKSSFSSVSADLRPYRLVFLQNHRHSRSRWGTRTQSPSMCYRRQSISRIIPKVSVPGVQRHGCCMRHNEQHLGAIDEDSVGCSSFDEWGDSDGMTGSSSYILSSSDGEDSDIELLINPVGDVDFPSVGDYLESSDGAVSLTPHRLGVLQKRHKTNRNQPGVFINMGLIAFLAMFLLFVDWCSWRIVRLPLKPFYLSYPFIISAVSSSFAGYICLPVLGSLSNHQIFRKEGPVMHSSKKGTPTMGGLFFVSIGIIVAITIAGSSSIVVYGAALATSAFAAIGLFDDILSLVKNRNNGLPAWLRVFLEVAVGIWFWFWLDSTDISSPYSMKMLVPLPEPLGLVYLGKFYPFFTSFCFVSMGSGINITDGLDGLAAGNAAFAFVGMSIAVLPICSELAIFGASMAGACVGFLRHNQYKASVFMGDTGSLALGGALAAMAACTGMFFPLLISSGVFVVELLSVILQVFYFKTTKCFYGTGHRLFRTAPFHHHLVLCGLDKPFIIACAYFISCILALFAGYVGLISA